MWGIAAATCLVVALCIAACGTRSCGCGGEDAPPLARLVSAEGSVERDHAESVGQWSAAAVEDRFHIGDGLRTGEAGSAVVELTRGGRLRLGPRSFVRFLADAPQTQQPRVQLETGGAEVAGGELGVEVQTPGGRLTVQETSEVAIDVDGTERVRFEVSVGQATFIDRDSEEHEVTRGELVWVNLDTGAVLRRPRGERSQESGNAQNTSNAPPDAGMVEGPVRLQVEGQRVEVRAPESRSWRRLEAGEAGVEHGARLRAGRDSAVKVSRGDATARLAMWGRAVVGGEGGSLLNVSKGVASGRSGGSSAVIRVPGGAIVLRPQAWGQVDVGRGGRAEVRALRGQLEVRGEGDPQMISLGEAAIVSADGEVEVLRAPTRAAITFSVGDSATVHDPSPPTSVAFLFGDRCPGEGMIEVIQPESQGAPFVARGERVAILRLRTGPNQYRLRCLTDGEPSGEDAGEGAIRVIADPGTTPIPTTPARNAVDADGRSFTVMYQNVMPQITFRWPDAPEASSYELQVTGANGRTSTKRSSRPNVTFRSGNLGQGTYRYRFAAAGGPRSPESTLRIIYDGAAALASISEPVNGAVAPGETVQVSGVALSGSSVSVDGQSIPFDSLYRFMGQATAPTSHTALAVKVSNPSEGTHYYLRHLSGRSGN